MSQEIGYTELRKVAHSSANRLLIGAVCAAAAAIAFPVVISWLT